MNIWEVICLLPPLTLHQQLPQWHKIASLSDVDGIRVTQCIICLFRAGVMQPEKEVLWVGGSLKFETHLHVFVKVQADADSLPHVSCRNEECLHQTPKYKFQKSTFQLLLVQSCCEKLAHSVLLKNQTRLWLPFFPR